MGISYQRRLSPSRRSVCLPSFPGSRRLRFRPRARRSERYTALVSRARCSAQLLRSAASQNRDPGFFESQVTGTPALQRTAPRRATRCAASGARKSVQIATHENVNVYLSPPFPLALHSTRPVQRGGASRGDPEVGQSESWPEGQPEGRCGAWGRASQAQAREALGFRPARNGVCHCELAGRGQASGAKTPYSRASSGACQVPGRTDQGFKTPRRSAERRCRVPLFPAIRETSRGR
jgi:hypothetical protein